MNPDKKINIAVDGYSSCGKGTLAKYLAKELGYRFIDSGAMYRAVTLYLIENRINPHAKSEVIAALPHIHLDFIPSGEGNNHISLNGEDVESRIRTLEVAGSVSIVSAIPEVRRFLVSQQREIGASKGVVMDGRDIGTVVFPDAELKIFMTARPDIRAERRYRELKAKGQPVDYQDVLSNLNERDQIDSSREDSPLLKAEDALVLDNSSLSIDEQNTIAMEWALARIAGA